MARAVVASRAEAGWLAVLAVASWLAACGSRAPAIQPRACGGDASPASSGCDAAASTDDAWLGQVIYLVMPDRFDNGDPSNDGAVAGCLDPGDPSKIHGGDLAGLRARIPYLVDLGVTAVWITPVYRQSTDRCGYHGYWADFVDPDDGGLAPNLGGAAELTALASDLHAANLRLVLDMVVNHAGVAAPVVTQHPDWFHDAATCAALGDPNVYCPVGGQPLPDFAQEQPPVAAYLSAESAGWIQRFAIDAVRMDTVKNVLPAYWASSWFPAMRAASPGLFVVGEDFTESGAAALRPYLDDGFDSLFDYPRYPAMVSTFAGGGSVDALAGAVADAVSIYGWQRALRMTSFVDNHDNPRLTSQVPAGTSDAETAQRFALALGAVFTLPGIPQLMWGDELGMLGAADPDNRRDMPAWAWSAATRAGTHAGASVGDGQAGYAYVQSLIALRKAHPALQRGSYAELWRQNGGPANLLAFFRGAGSDRVIVAINPGPAASVALPIGDSDNLDAGDKAALPDGTVLNELLGAGAPPGAVVAGGRLPLVLPAATIGVYLAAPPDG
jgi:alpha-amylase